MNTVSQVIHQAQTDVNMNGSLTVWAQMIGRGANMWVGSVIMKTERQVINQARRMEK